MAHKEGYWMTHTWQSGRVGEKTVFFVPGKRPSPKNRRKIRDAAKKAAQNDASAVKELARLINANFGKGDYLMGLDYSDEALGRLEQWLIAKGFPLDEMNEEEKRDAMWLAADHAMVNCIRRAKYRCAKLGVELKTAYITSDMNGETKERVRVHHHMVVNREARGAFAEAWREYGYADWTKFYDNQVDRTPIAQYMLEQVRQIHNAKSYRSTRNLIRPKAVPRLVPEKDAGKRLQAPRGAEIVYATPYERGKDQYIRYILPVKIEPGAGKGKVRPEDGIGVDNGSKK